MGMQAALSFLAADSSTALIALAGALGGAIGGALIAGGFGVYNQRRTRETADLAWLKDTRRLIYGQSLERAQAYLIACEALKDTPSDPTLRDKVEAAHSQFFETYGVIQVVAGTELVQTARAYAYRLEELKNELDGKGVFDPDASIRDRAVRATSKADAFFWMVARSVRLARHYTIDEMRKEMSLSPGDWPDDQNYNPYLGKKDLPALAQAYKEFKAEQEARDSAQA
jgi:hypothetical protein